MGCLFWRGGVGRGVSQVLYATLYYTPLLTSTRADRGDASPGQLCRRKRALFRRGTCTTTVSPLRTCMHRVGTSNGPLPSANRQRRTRCVLMYTTCRLESPGDVSLLHTFLSRCPSAPRTGHVCTLVTSSCFFRNGCSSTLTVFGSTHLSLLNARRHSSVACHLTAYCLGANGMGRTTV